MRETQIRILNYNSNFALCCLKLFILKKFYFLILKLNMEPLHKYSSKWIIKYKNQRVYNKLIVKKKCFTIIIKKMDNLHFIPNNILTNFF